MGSVSIRTDNSKNEFMIPKIMVLKVEQGKL